MPSTKRDNKNPTTDAPYIEPVLKIDYELTTDKAGRKRAYKVNLETGKKSPVAYKVAQKRKGDLKYRRKRQGEEGKAWALIGAEVIKRHGTRKKAMQIYHKSRKRKYTPKKSAEFAMRHTGEEVIYRGFYQFSEKVDGEFYDPFVVSESPGRDEYTNELIDDRPGVGYESIYIHGDYGNFDEYVCKAEKTFEYYLSGHRRESMVLHYGGYQVSYVDKETGTDLIPPEIKQFTAKGIDHDPRMLED